MKRVCEVDTLHELFLLQYTLIMQATSKFILRLFGWKAVLSVQEEPKSVICIAPHTTNWDFILGKLGCSAMGWKSSFLMKKEWFFFPLGAIFKAIGGIPVDRSRKTSLTDQLAAVFIEREHFHLAIAPEGTRKPVADWKQGFYHIAMKANVPIQLAYIDGAKKEVGIGATFYPTGNVEADMKKIRAFYQNTTAIKSKNFLKIKE